MTDSADSRSRRPLSGLSCLPDDARDIDITRILDILKHRFPMLMVDRVEDYHPGKSLTLRKCITYNEPFFRGHFPDRPVMPGVMILETMAQAASLTAVVDLPDTVVEDVALASIDKARFRYPVIPGDVLLVTCQHDRNFGRFYRFNCSATVDDRVVATAQVMALNIDKASLIDKKSKQKRQSSKNL